jgi:hypothetical protein
MNKKRNLLLALVAVRCLTLPASAAPVTRVYQQENATPVKNREGVVAASRLARLSNDRALYQLSYSANEGASVRLSEDKQNEATRRPYQPYRPAPTTAEVGFSSLGLNSGSWNDLGFFNFYINDVGLNYVAPELTTQQSATQSSARFVWKNSQATVTQTFVLRARDDKLLMKLEVAPRAGVAIERLVLQLRNDWNRANSAYNNPWVLNGAVTTARGESTPPRRLDLTTEGGNWIVYHNKALGIGPSALLFAPSEIARGQVLLGSDKSVTTFFLDPQKRAFHFALWETPKQRDDAFINYLKSAAPQLSRVLATLAVADWSKPLPPVEAEAPLHLTGATYAAAADEKTRGFIAYASHPLRYVDANTLPGGKAPQLALQAAPGQDEQAAFSLYALRDLGRVTVEPSTLTNANGGAIPAQSVDVRVVKVWPQQTGVWGGSNGEFQMTPELLVRNDTLSLDDAWTGPGTFHPNSKGEKGFITGPAITEIPRDTSRQFWLLVRTPQNAAPGTYRGQLTVKAEKGGVLQLPLSVEVLPIAPAALDGRYVLSIYYRGKPQVEGDAAPKSVSSDNITPDRFRGELQDIKDHGFNAAWLMSPSLEKFKTAMLPVYNELGFSGPVGISGWGYAYNSKFDAATDEAHKARIREYLSLFAGPPAPMFYGIDEPHGDRVALNTKRADLTRSVEVNGLRGQYSSAGDGNAMAEQVGHLDYPIISTYFSSRDLMKTLRDRYKEAGAHPLYYWQIWGEYPQGSRLNAGYFLYASGYEGITPYAYQHFASDPYREDQKRIDSPNSSLKNMMVSYPCNEGEIPTLQWEAARAGIWDLRYLVTLGDAIKKAEGRVLPAQLDAARAALQELLEKYGYKGSEHWGKMIYGALNWPDHQVTVEPEQFDQDRRTVAEWILKLQQ